MRCVFIFFVLALLASCATDDAVTDRQPGQVMICHDGNSILVSNANMFVHENHGDALGPCADDG
jgi:hypothetical protein